MTFPIEHCSDFQATVAEDPALALFIWKWMKTDSRYNKCLSAGLRAAQVGLCDNHNTDKPAAQDGKSFF